MVFEKKLRLLNEIRILNKQFNCQSIWKKRSFVGVSRIAKANVLKYLIAEEHMCLGETLATPPTGTLLKASIKGARTLHH